MPTPKQPDASAPVVNAKGLADRDWRNYWKDIAGGGNPTGTIGLTAVNGSASTLMRSDASPALSQAIAPDWTGTHRWRTSTPLTTAAMDASGTAAAVLQITPRNNKIGITVNQTLSGTTAFWSGSDFTVTDSSVYQNFGAIKARTNVAAGWANGKAATSIDLEVTGASSAASGVYAPCSALAVNAYATLAPVSAFTNSVDLFAANFLAWTGASGTRVFHLYGLEIDVAAHASAPAQGRIGLAIVSSTVPSDGSAGVQAVSGIHYDTALTISKFGTAAAWGTGIRAVSTNGAYPFNTNSKFISSEAGTCGWGLDFGSMTFTQFAIVTPGFSVDPSGNIQLGSSVTCKWFSTGNSTASATAGAATALPANPVGYLRIMIDGVDRKLPYYAS